MFTARELNEAGRGSTFALQLTRIQRLAAAETSAQTESLQRRVLVVDDNAEAANAAIQASSPRAARHDRTGARTLAIFEWIGQVYGTSHLYRA